MRKEGSWEFFFKTNLEEQVTGTSLNELDENIDFTNYINLQTLARARNISVRRNRARAIPPSV